MNIMPRIQGRVGVIEDPPELKGLFTYELRVTFIGLPGEENLTCKESFKTEQEAHAKMKAEIKRLCDFFEEKIAGEVSGHYIDMKTNEVRRWDGLDIH